MGENINACRVLVGKLEEMKRLEYLVKDGKTIIKLTVKKIL
jgi:hypothetical protein